MTLVRLLRKIYLFMLLKMNSETILPNVLDMYFAFVSWID